MSCNPKYHQSTCTRSKLVSKLSISREICGMGNVPDGDTVDGTRFMVLFSVIQGTTSKNWRQNEPRVCLSRKYNFCELKRLIRIKIRTRLTMNCCWWIRGKKRECVNMGSYKILPSSNITLWIHTISSINSSCSKSIYSQVCKPKLMCSCLLSHVLKRKHFQDNKTHRLHRRKIEYCKVLIVIQNKKQQNEPFWGRVMITTLQPTAKTWR